LGSKNKVMLGFITNYMFHHIRNEFSDKKLYITKRKLELIKSKHALEYEYIKSKKFQAILDNCISKCLYSKDEKVLNFISFIDGKYILYGISNNSYYTHLSTIFYPSKKQLINCKATMKFFSEKSKQDFEEFLNKKN
jgi:hypothetical protein